MSWPSAMALWISVEGGFIETNPPEGPTYCGVLQTYYFQWCAKVGRDPIWPPTQEAHASYLYDEIWTPHHCGDIPDPADAVATGSEGASETATTTVGDGINTWVMRIYSNANTSQPEDSVTAGANPSTASCSSRAACTALRKSWCAAH